MRGKDRAAYYGSSETRVDTLALTWAAVVGAPTAAPRRMTAYRTTTTTTAVDEQVDA